MSQAGTTPTSYFFQEHNRTYSIRFLRDEIVRIQFWPQGKPQTLKTWSIVDSTGFWYFLHHFLSLSSSEFCSSAEGHETQACRPHLEPVALPEVVTSDSSLSFCTEHLMVRVPTVHSFAVQWYAMDL
jgi:hypothetical protein